MIDGILQDRDEISHQDVEKLVMLYECIRTEQAMRVSEQLSSMAVVRNDGVLTTSGN